MSDPRVVVCAIVGVVVLGVAAVLTGHDGTIVNLALVLVAGLGGFSLGRVTRKREA